MPRRPRFIEELFGALRDVFDAEADEEPPAAPPPPQGAPGTREWREAERKAAREFQRQLNENLARLVDEMVKQYASPRGRTVTTSDGRVFMFTGEYRRVMPSEVYWNPRLNQLREMPAGPPATWNIDIPWPPADAHGFILVELKSAYEPPPRRPTDYTDPRRLAALKVLGCKADATPDEIKARYRELVRRYHPDRSKDPRHRGRLAKINAAATELGIAGGRAGRPENPL